MGASGPSEFVHRHKSRVSQGPESHAAAGPDGEPGDAAVVKAHPQPALRRKLQSPEGHHDTTDHNNGWVNRYSGAIFLAVMPEILV